MPSEEIVASIDKHLKIWNQLKEVIEYDNNHIGVGRRCFGYSEKIS